MVQVRRATVGDPVQESGNDIQGRASRHVVEQLVEPLYWGETAGTSMGSWLGLAAQGDVDQQDGAGRRDGGYGVGEKVHAVGVGWTAPE